jgi:geranylgeranyl pyrophosphate synthase
MVEGVSWEDFREATRRSVRETVLEVGIDPEMAALISRPGRCNRGALVLAIASTGRRPDADNLTLAASVELVHRASVIRDDVQDQDLVRRGESTLHASIGVPAALAVADVLLATGLGAATCWSAEAGNILISAIQEMAIGQFMDICGPLQKFRDAPYELARLKTGSLVGAAFSIGALSVGLPTREVDSMYVCGADLGTAFQLLNDVRNARGVEDRGRGPASDLASGRFSSVALVLGDQAAGAGLAELQRAVALVEAEAMSLLRGVPERIRSSQSSLPPALLDLLISSELASAFVADQN